MPSVPVFDMSTLTLNTDPVACFLAALASEVTIRTSSSTRILRHSFLIVVPAGPVLLCEAMDKGLFILWYRYKLSERAYY